MELVLAQHLMQNPGGSETYLVTVADHLQRLGHEVTVFTIDAGEMAEIAAAGGLRVATDESELPPHCDAVVAQDTIVSLSLADRYPDSPQLFVVHSIGIDSRRPTQLEGTVSKVVVLNDRSRERLKGLAHQDEIVRLRQPIDITRFGMGHRDARPAPERVLALSNYLDGEAREMLASACDDLGLEFGQVGFPERLSRTPELELAAADIVVGHGRSALEGMSCGRAVYVFDHAGADGWVTSETYPSFESRGFTGLASGAVIDTERLRHDLAGYKPDMGPVNRQLVCANHHAADHAAELVGILGGLSTNGGRPQSPRGEMARLARLQRQAEDRARTLARLNNLLRDELDHERTRAAAELDALKSTRRYRLGQALARPIDALRRLLRRGG